MPQTETPVWTLKMDLGIRPMTFATNPDGSTKWIFVQLTGLNGFAVVDFATHKEITRIEHPALSGREVDRTGRIGPLARRAGHRRRQDARCLQPLEQLPVPLFAAGPETPGRRRTRGQGSRLGTLTPDGKMAYVANPVTNDVSVVDITAMKEVARIPVGFVPKRNTTAMLQ